MGDRKIFGQNYSEGDFIDNTIEHFAGPHDFLSSWNYENIEGTTYAKKWWTFLWKATSGFLLFPASLFATSTTIENNLEYDETIWNM